LVGIENTKQLLEFCLIRLEKIYVLGGHFSQSKVEGFNSGVEKVCCKLIELLHHFLFYTYVCIKIIQFNDATTFQNDIETSCLHHLCCTTFDEKFNETFREQMEIIAELKSQ